MDEKLISSMSEEEFDAVIDAYIERETADTGELDAPLFYEALREMVRASSNAASENEIEGTIEDDQLVLRLPADMKVDFRSKDIEVFVGGRRLSVKVK